MARYYLNTDPIRTYEDICNDENYVDKTGLIAFVNSKIRNPHRLILVSRPRWFGKTYAAASYDADKLEKEHHCKIERVQLPRF